ncbi:hypothetical protein ACH5RR_032013 [Cinchona calisaya]|uniref:beta-galactosidase n=1 Tax=Cinchona calisaya TaxID=153742 RepID=A0ABD2YGW9_9GENT
MRVISPHDIQMWPSLIKNAKDGGLDAIETYVFWNAHEPHYREDEVKIFTTLIVDMMKKEKLFTSQGGPIILAQIENEFGAVTDKFGNDTNPYLNWNINSDKSLNIVVPWIMCQQADAPEPITTVYSYNGSRVCFFGNANKDRDLRITFEGRNYTVPAWSVSILPDYEIVVYNTTRVHTQTNVLDKVNSVMGLEWQWRVEPIQHISQKYHTKPPTVFATELFDQKTVINDTSDYLWYMTMA